MDYWEVREALQAVIPRQGVVSSIPRPPSYVKEKGRKSNYRQFDLKKGEFVRLERLLNVDEIKSFVEVSLRASACPMPLNLDVWDGIVCPFNCIYCFANYFRASLYTAFFDNYKDLGLRHSNPEGVIKGLGKLFELRGQLDKAKGDVARAVALEVPLRFGIRFEDFLPIEGVKQVSLRILKFLAEEAYPVMINTKGVVLEREEYVRALADNPAGAAVHFTILSTEEAFVKKFEPGAPSVERRLRCCKILSDAGVRVVVRIEPFSVFWNDSRDMLEDFAGRLREAGVGHMTFDSYSYSAHSEGLARAMSATGYDYWRMFLASSDSQWLSSFMLGLVMDWWRGQGFSCSTFDYGNVAENDDHICCSVGDWFGDYGFNWGSGVGAIRFIRSRGGAPVTWSEFEAWVEEKGGFLSPALRREVQEHWNCEGNKAFSLEWADGIEPCGFGPDGRIWRATDRSWRKRLMEDLLGVKL